MSFSFRAARIAAAVVLVMGALLTSASGVAAQPFPIPASDSPQTLTPTIDGRDGCGFLDPRCPQFLSWVWQLVDSTVHP